MCGCNKQVDSPAKVQPAEVSSGTTGLPQQKQPIIQQAEPPGDGTPQTVKYGESGDDEQLSYGGDDVELPDGWPDFLAVYQGAKLISAQRQEQVTGPFLVVGFETHEEISLVMEFYEKVLLKKGYKKTKETIVERHMICKFSSPGRGVEIACQTEELRNVVYLSTWKIPGS